ncbi:MFS transporter [Actinomadura verrucosospora]|uniref:Drug resistance efflux protein n=1 Tax=Actinomadura verrucosospora TaxID=46165 RepID=A0A7D3W1J0_ACTVE|nr:MFS transporter [Actinomadura verrucosospora]QKG24072.1 drug resistance efflux protein [Actinomadura verrucosospora]
MTTEPSADASRSASADRAAGALRRPAPWAPLAACCLGTFLLLLYTTVTTVALPSIGADLHAGFGARQWIIDVYTLALAGPLLGAGALGDALGPGRLYPAGSAVFGLATLACGLAASPPWLIAARAVQGTAGAAMFASILPLIGSSYTGRAKATAFAVWGAVAGAASAVGTVGGGVLAEYAGWRWTFLGALPLCVLALAMAVRFPPPAGPAKGRPRPGRAAGAADWPGITTITIAVTASVYAVIAAGESGWTGPGPVVGWLTATVAMTAFVLVERAASRPVLPPALFATPGFAGVLLVAFGYYFAAFGALPGLAAWLQADVGLGALATSLALVTQLLTFIAVSGLAGGRLHALRPRWTLGAGTVLVGIGALTGITLNAGSSRPALLPFLILSGIGAGIVSPVLPAVAMASVPARHAGTAGAAANAARQFGLTLGVAVCGTLTRTAHVSGVRAALVLCGVLAALAGTLASVLLRHHAGAAVRSAGRDG